MSRSHIVPLFFLMLTCIVSTWQSISTLKVAFRSIKNGIWSAIYTFVYVVWTIIHYFLQIGKGVSCDDYPIDECPIYDAIDWNEPASTIGYLAGAFVALVVVLLLYTGLVRCRVCCDRGTPRGVEEKSPA